ncbi:hypothetical protein TNCV_4147741 [Trichonephila clavipes]|nr:hypothetical protein TNCV_4147741 [Trichonephila clavipes]
MPSPGFKPKPCSTAVNAALTTILSGWLRLISLMGNTTEKKELRLLNEDLDFSIENLDCEVIPYLVYDQLKCEPDFVALSWWTAQSF